MLKRKNHSEVKTRNKICNMSDDNYYRQKLKNIKQNLMVRDTNRQLVTVDYILHNLKHPKKSIFDLDHFLLNDLPGILCDTMNNHNSKLIRKVFECLTLLSKSTRFYKEHHAMVVLETTVRLLKILVKDISQMSVIKSGLKLLSGILQKLHIKNTAMNCKILNLVHYIVNTSLLQPLHLKAFFILQPITKDLSQLSACQNYLLYVYQRALKYLGNITRSTVYVYTSILSDTIRHSLRLCWHITNGEENPSSEKSSIDSIKEKVKSLLWTNIKNIISPSLINSDINKCNIRDLDKILKCLLTALTNLSPDESNNLSHYLATLGYLVVLPKLNTQLRSDVITKHSNALMSQIISQLCETTLKIGKFFMKKQFQLCIDKGIMALPADTSLWTQVLMDSSNKYAQYTTIIYMYFMLLSYKSPAALIQAYRPAVCTYLTNIKNRIPLPILKAIWLIYAVTSVSTTGKHVSSKDSLLRASKTLVDMLQSEHSVKKLYTHHPAVIYWLFKSHYIDRKMQCTVMKLWFSDESQESYDVMLSLAMNSHLASLCLFEILQSCNASVAEKGTKILAEVISRDKTYGSSGLSVIIWETLPKILSRSSFSVKSVMNVNCVLYLASQCVPSHLNTALFIRLSVQINKLITRFIGEEECYRSLRILLSRIGLNMTMITLNNGDLTILKIFLDSDKLITVLVQELFVSCPVVNSHLQFLGILIHYQHFYCIKTNIHVNMKSDIFQQLLTSPMNEEIISTLSIISVMFDTSRKITPLIFISEHAKIGFIQTLFYQLQMLCTKSAVQVVKSSWRNQHLLLKFCSVYKMQNLETHLATHPFTHLALQQCTLSYSSDFWLFVSTWLDSLHKCNKLVLCRRKTHNQTLCTNSMAITLTGISEELFKAVDLESKNKSLQNIVIKILILNANIPERNVRALTRIACDYNKVTE